jgi:Relaxase/Mobilisation nuclease domain
MVLRANIRGGGSALAQYLMAEGKNDAVVVFDIKGTSQPADLKKSLIEMSLTSELSGRTKKGLYHVVINPRPGDDRLMTKEQWLRAAEIIEEDRKLIGHKRIMVMHEKKNRLHMHVAWERYNHDTGRMNCNRHSQYDLKRSRLKMEQEFGQESTSEVNKERPVIRKLLSRLWQEYPEGRRFCEALLMTGYTVASQQGRRPFVLVTSQGRTFDLVKEIPGAKSQTVRERLKGIILPDKIQVIDECKRTRNNRNRKRDKVVDDIKSILQSSKDRTADRGR